MASATMEIAHNAENTAAAAQHSTSSSADGRNLVNQTRGSITSLANEVGEATAIKEVGDELADGAMQEQRESQLLQQQAQALNEKVARFIL